MSIATLFRDGANSRLDPEGPDCTGVNLDLQRILFMMSGALYSSEANPVLRIEDAILLGNTHFGSGINLTVSRQNAA